MPNLDPTDWSTLRSLGHRMLDDMFDHLAGLRDGPVWQEMPEPLRWELRAPLPREPGSPEGAYDEFRRLVLPYSTGNLHPGFMGWVHGGSNPIGMLAELLAGGLNANIGGRNHAPVEVERQVIAWAAEMLGFPPDASGVLVTGTSIANLIGLLVARTAALGPSVRKHGVQGVQLIAYTSAAAHGCISRAVEIAGLGRDALRMIPCDREGRI
ncbi:MAG TPA: pyridoxal-dependent decarboxylase, partial [Acetobacteraceae bacterium]|nr:pyridoxal-dependent decarboxylase [Acetobacteraceae bacterium]